jgi:signal transduction histidine kinase
LIEVTMPSQPLRAAMLDYGLRILALSAFISVITAVLLFFSVRALLVRPIRHVVDAITNYASAPEDARHVIDPSSTVTELRQAEEALRSMQTQLTGALRQKERLAQLGGAVAKISHDLRNILTTAQLFTDRMEQSEDPAVRRVVPKLINSMSRAVNLCESTLSFGKAEEPAPRLERTALLRLVDDVIESEKLAADEQDLEFDLAIPERLEVRADPEQLHRVLTNLVRNSRQALRARPGKISITAQDLKTEWIIEVHDNGPGLPEKAQAHLFEAFHGGARAGGVGLGLAIAAELMRGHGGALILNETGPDGTSFTLHLPKGLQAEALAAQ